MSGYSDRQMLGTIDRHIAELTKRIRQLEQRPFFDPSAFSDLVDPNAGGGGGGGGGCDCEEYATVSGLEWAFSSSGFYMGGDTLLDQAEAELLWAPFDDFIPPGSGNWSDAPIPLLTVDSTDGTELDLEYPPGYVVAPSAIGPLTVSATARVFWRGGADVWLSDIGDTALALTLSTGWDEPPMTAVAISDILGPASWVHATTWEAGVSYVDLSFTGLTVNGGGFPGGRPISLRLRAFQEDAETPESWLGFAVESASLTVTGA